MASLASAPASLARLVRPICGEDELEQLLDLLAEARIVMLGTASYGTHEHFDLRASLTRKLVRDRGFVAVLVEADWPDALRIDRYVRNQTDEESAAVALHAFDHFPSWAWRNTDVASFIEWLRIQNCCRPVERRVGFYGLDRYSLNASTRAIRTHPDEGNAALIAELVDMQWRHAARSGRAPSGEAWLHALQRNRPSDAQTYYRTLLAGGVEASNLRARQMADTIEMVACQLGREDEPARLVVWAHDAHVGDARATTDGRVSLGQCLRERRADEVALVGCTTYHGTVRCAAAWDAPATDMRLPEACSESWEAMFHETGIPRFMITASGLRRAIGDHGPRLHRRIGAVMRVEPYVEARLADHYDVVVHVDTTRAVRPDVGAG